MAGRKVKTAGFDSSSCFSEAGQLEEDQASLISDLEGSISVNRQLLHVILKEHTSSARNGPSTASRIPIVVAEAMIKENALMERRLQRLNTNYEELVSGSYEIAEKIKEAWRSESAMYQSKTKELSAMQTELATKDKIIERLKEKNKVTQFEVDSMKKTLMPSSSRESMHILESKSDQIRDFKKKLGFKLRYTETRRDQVISAYQQLITRKRAVQQDERPEAVSDQKPLEDLGYDEFWNLGSSEIDLSCSGSTVEDPQVELERHSKTSGIKGFKDDRLNQTFSGGNSLLRSKKVRKLLENKLNTVRDKLAERVLQFEALQFELYDVHRLQGTLQHDHELLTTAVLQARERLDLVYSKDPELRSIMEEEQSTTTELRSVQKWRKEGLRIRFD
mmetsp:Transcript_7614/g.14338  ORF Transcript_7614/g.14338 Transcript_7614/m.14338 type:complete len:391 (-) Transcript_7614:3062-4234(-)